MNARALAIAAASLAASSCGGDAIPRALVAAGDAVLVGGSSAGDLRTRVQLLGATAGARGRVHGDHIDIPNALGPGFDLVRETRGDEIEDFVKLPRPLEGSRVRYRLDTSSVAGLRLVARTLELLDAHGAPRLRMLPPWVRDRSGAYHDASVRVVDCAVDDDPRAPWDRPVTAPGSASCTVEIAWQLEAGAYPALLDPGWTPCGQLANGRGTHAATLLANGRVLVSGGYSNLLASDLASSELFDPATKTFAATGPLPSPRRAHVTTRLEDGRVVSIGGDVGLGTITVSSSVDRYDPSTGLWSPAASLTTARSHATVTRLSKSGELLVVGGLSDYTSPATALDSVEICAKDGASCRVSTSMNEPRADHSATELKDGRVLVAGGGVRIFNEAASLHATTAIFDPALSSWSNGPPLPSARFGHTAVRSTDGTVFLLGGARAPQGSSISAEIVALAPGGAAFAVVGALEEPRWIHGSALLPSGKILTVGGATEFYQLGTLRLTEVFDPVSKTSQGIADLVPMHFHTVTSLDDGRVLVAGGGTAPTVQNQGWLYEEAKPGADAGVDGGPTPAIDAATPPADASADAGVDVGAASPAAETTGFYACALAEQSASGSPLGAVALATASLMFALRRTRPRRVRGR
ncbi:MAG: hypothetical protein JST00_47775 [Deltaproteobacteria bacterium]|nr:hypothetical protein [Deltaproteobacteria bacterium]